MGSIFPHKENAGESIDAFIMTPFGSAVALLVLIGLGPAVCLTFAGMLYWLNRLLELVLTPL